MAQSKTGITADEIKSDQLYGLLIKSRIETAVYKDTAILDKVRAAEDFYESTLNIFLGKRKIISGATERGIVVNPDAEIPEVEEAPYDYDQDFFYAGRWGYKNLRNRPVIPDRTTPSGITRMFIAFPSAKNVIYDIPQGWIKPDFDQGKINLVPATGAILASFSTFFLTIVAGGAYELPNIIYIDYFAGFEKARLLKDNADLIEGIKMRTVLFMGGILGNIRAEGIASRSLGLDGLSHSRSFGGGKYGPYSGMIQLYIEQEKEIRENFRNSKKGVIFTAV